MHSSLIRKSLRVSLSRGARRCDSLFYGVVWSEKGLILIEDITLCKLTKIIALPSVDRLASLKRVDLCGVFEEVK